MLARLTCLLLLFALGLLVPMNVTHADESGLTEEYLNDPGNIALGKELFQRQCARCHGSKAYPGKAPKLKPKKLSPEDVYLRITYGFRKMPPWEDVFTEEELMAITAYVKSRRFSN